MSFLEELNDSQRAAVTYTQGPSLVIAGAGSGKTRVLTYKIAYLLQQGIPAQQLLALTFTNKAAREMKARIINIVGENTSRYLWMGTFHAIFARILRTECDKLGYTKDFTIYDTTDTKSVLKSIIKDMQLDDKTYKTSTIYGRISMAKNNLISAKAYAQNTDIIKYDKSCRLYKTAEIYQEYTRRCKQANAMDFDDLLFNTNVLFRDFPDVLQKYQHQFRYILVDEYQDTNFAQYLIVKKLAEIHQHICVVGDDAQSIYAFRGANIKNILQFQQNYSNAKLFKLERNYRSTKTIVNAANSLIENNQGRIPKVIYSDNEEGELIHLLCSYSDIEESNCVAKKIEDLHLKKQLVYNEIAILYRTNAQSRTLENTLRKQGIPYRIYGGLSFYQRKEIKDAIAYFRFVANPNDEESLKRIINYPTRGIGETTVAKLLNCAHTQNTPVWQVLRNPLAYNVPVNAGTTKKLNKFYQMMSVFMQQAETLDAYELGQSIMRTTGMMADAMNDSSPEGISRHENLQELLNAIHEHTEEQLKSGQTFTPITNFLADISLQTDQDDDATANDERVTLMTVHAAKGLEFHTVFIVGMEENLFPSQFIENEQELEEERRLFYVAITRAKAICYISYAQSRFRNGKTNFCNPSRFISEINEQYFDHKPHKKQTTYDQTFDFDEERTIFEQPKKTISKFTKTGNTYLKTSEKQLIECAFTAGCKVQHSIFGIGKVLCCYSENGNDKIDIDFEDKGKKSLLLKFAKLTMISN